MKNICSITPMFYIMSMKYIKKLPSLHISKYLKTSEETSLLTILDIYIHGHMTCTKLLFLWTFWHGIQIMWIILWNNFFSVPQAVHGRLKYLMKSKYALGTKDDPGVCDQHIMVQKLIMAVIDWGKLLWWSEYPSCKCQVLKNWDFLSSR